MELKNINWKELRDRAYQNAVKHGFYENRTMIEDCMLIITELGEAVNAHRKGCHARRSDFEKRIDCSSPVSNEYWMSCYEVYIKDKVEDEIADTFIRMLSFLGHANVEVDTDFLGNEPVNLAKEFMTGKSFAEQVYTIVFSIVLDDDLNCAITRLITLAIIHDIDLLWHVEQKMKYNELRPYKHGKKY